MRKLLIGCAAATLAVLCPPSGARPPAHLAAFLSQPSVQQTSFGVASWYGEELHGNLTASGEVFDMNGLTAAHRDLPIGTRIIVTNLRNNRSVTLRVNDRGPSISNRMLDVSKAAARSLGFVDAGLASVRVEVVSHPPQTRAKIPVSVTF